MRRFSTPTPRRGTRSAAIAGLLLSLALAASSGAEPPSSLVGGFTGTIGYGRATGTARDFLDDDWSADFSVFLEKGRFRGGIGTTFKRFTTTDPVPFPELSTVPFYLSGTFTPWTRGKLRPYLQARVGLERVHVQPTLDRAAPAKGGWSYGLVPGLEVDLSRRVALDLSLDFNRQQTDPLRLGDAPGSELESWTDWTARFGLTWRPRVYGAGPPLPGTPEPGPWGVRPSVGLAAGQTLLALSIASVYNEYFHDANFVQVSPRTWWRNLERGFEYDANKFDTNHFYHPWNGMIFFSAGRSNGLGFWKSSSIALAGSFLWECCGETLKMSTPDMVSTSLGGVAMGEMVHRLGSVALDNRDTGASRVLREVGVGVVDWVRGINRLFVGEQRRAPNPTDPFEWRPPRLGALVAAGARSVGNDGSLGGEGSKTAPFLDLWVAYGSVIDNERRRPYDSFELRTQINFTDRVDPVGGMTIRGDLASKPLGDPGSRHGAVTFVQHFDYLNQRTLEFGAQSLGLGLSHRVRPSPSTRVELRGDLLATVLGSLNANFEFVEPQGADVSYRRYDYGPGLGAWAEAVLLAGPHPIAQLSYRYQWIHVTNGTPTNGGAADHQLQIAALRLRAPLGRRLGLGVDGEVYQRTSHYGNPLLVERDDRIPQVRAYLSWTAGAF